MRQHASGSLEREILHHRLEQKINPKPDPGIREGDLVESLHGNPILFGHLEYCRAITGVVACYNHDVLERYAVGKEGLDLGKTPRTSASE